jgi:hypothetical protein
MSTGHKVLIGVGALILVGMIAVGSFCLGVYVGEHGWTRRGLTLAGPGATVQPRDRPQMPGRPPDLQGVVQGLARGNITLRTPQGSRTVLVNQETRMMRDDEEARLADLRRGMGVAVFGDLRDQGRTLVARLIVILPPLRR